MIQNLISVVIPVYNSARFVTGAIESIRAQLYNPLEIIIIDDGSTDDLPAVVARLETSVNFVRQENRGPAAARNLGIRNAEGEYLAFLDADDRWPEGKLKLQSDLLQRRPDVQIVLGHVRYVLLDGATALDQDIVTQLGDIAHVHLGSGLYRANVFEQIGLFDEAMRQGEDLDWFMRAREFQLKTMILPEVTLLYQRHKTNITRDLIAGQGGVLATVRKSLNRRRNASGVAADLEPWTEYLDGHNK